MTRKNDREGDIAEIERRAADRYPVDVPLTLSIGDQSVACRMVEMSAMGARLRSERPLEVGDTLVLDLPSAGRTEATVVRCTDSYVAVSFEGAVIVAQLSSPRYPSLTSPANRA